MENLLNVDRPSDSDLIAVSTSLHCLDETDLTCEIGEVSISNEEVGNALKDMDRYVTPPSSPREKFTAVVNSTKVEFPPTPSPELTRESPPPELHTSTATADTNHTDPETKNGNTLKLQLKDEKIVANKVESRPELSYVALIGNALLAAPGYRLILGDIYQYIQTNYPYYKDNQRGWKNSVRHNLSLSDCFVKVGKADVGKGNYWGINPGALNSFLCGNFRDFKTSRKRRRRQQQRTDVYGKAAYSTTENSSQNGNTLSNAVYGASSTCEPMSLPPPLVSRTPSTISHLAEMDAFYLKREPFSYDFHGQMSVPSHYPDLELPTYDSNYMCHPMRLNYQFQNQAFLPNDPMYRFDPIYPVHSYGNDYHNYVQQQFH